MRPELFFLTGIALSNPGGTGRFLQKLKQQFHGNSDVNANFFKPGHEDFSLSSRYAYLSCLSNSELCTALIRIPNMVVCHPQGLGLNWTIKILRERKHTWYFVLDNGFFCARSYNHLPHEYHACHRCLKGNFSARKENDCEPFPYKQENYETFFTELHALAKKGRVSFITQNSNSTSLVKRHFGKNTNVHTAGICADYDFLGQKEILDKKNRQYDCVFHANHLPPKGMFWVMRLAQKLPDYSFLFPFAASQARGESITANMHFIPMSWETGLKDAVTNSKVTLCPSMWSAPIEGALVKSLYYSDCVGIVDEATSYSNQLPNDILLRIPKEINMAAEQLKGILNGAITSMKPVAHMWLKTFNTEMDTLHVTISQIVLSR